MCSFLSMLLLLYDSQEVSLTCVPPPVKKTTKKQQKTTTEEKKKRKKKHLTNKHNPHTCIKW